MPGPESETLTVWISALTDTGKVRRHNEDYIGYLVPENHGARAIQGALMVVCDGVGGGSAGEVASERAVHRILDDYYTQSTSLEIEDRLLAAIQQANAELYAENQHDPEARPMSTTVVAALIVGRDLLVAHAGDSRAYLARGSQITQVTTDHSWVAEMVEAGDLTPEEAEKHPWRNRITRGLGLKEEVELDVQEIALEARDVILLCSDGLTRHIGDDEILDAVTRYSPERAVQHLVRLANMRGGKDNISALIAEVLTETELAARLSQAEVADEETQVPVQPRRAVDRRKLCRILPLAAVAALLLLLCGISVRALQKDMSSLTSTRTSTPTAIATVTRPSETLAKKEPVLGRVVADDGVRLRGDPLTETEATPTALLYTDEKLIVRAWHRPIGVTRCPSNFWLWISTLPAGEIGWVCGDYVDLPGGQRASAETVLMGLGLPTIIPSTPTATTVATLAPSPTLTPIPTLTFTPTHTPTSSATFTPSAAASRSALPTAGYNVSPVATPEMAGDAEFQVIGAANAGRLTWLGQAPLPEGKVQAAVFLSDSSQLGVLLAGEVWLYKLTLEGSAYKLLGQPFLLIPPSVSGYPQSLAALPGNRLMVGLDNGDARIWRAGPLAWQDSPNWRSSLILAASPDGLLVTRGMTDSRVGIWQIGAQNGGPKLLHELEFPDSEAAVHAVSFASLKQSASYRLAGGTEGGVVCLWHINSSSDQSPSFPCISLTPSPGGVTSMALSENGEVLATGASNGKIRFWSASEGAEISAQGLNGHSGPVNALAFSSNGTLLLSASENEGIKLWGVPR